MIVKHAARKPNTRDRLVGLLAYLAGPGRFEEHTDQRIVAAWSSDVTDIEIREPSEQMGLAHEMEAPARLREMPPPAEGFVYHVPISLHPDDPRLSDEQWAYVARKTVAALGFEDCRWIAVHHGLARSADGPRDHIHLVVHRARENGTIASTWNDRYKMAAVRAELEDDPTLGLVVKTQRKVAGRGGWQHGERDRAERAGRSEVDRDRLERLVRASVGPAESEADWVRLLRGQGVLVRPRYERGGRSAVVGYSVALPPESGQTPVWFGGGNLALDLTLPAIRNRWDGHDPADALGVWSRRGSERRAGVRGSRAESVWPLAQQHLAEFERVLAVTPLSDVQAWRAIARETAEAVAGLSTRAPAREQAMLGRAGLWLSRAAEMPHGQRRGAPSPGAPAMRAACSVMTTAAISGRGGMATVAVLIEQLMRFSDAVARANAARDAAGAARMAAAAAAELRGLGASVEAGAAGPHGVGRAAILAARGSADRPGRGNAAPEAGNAGRVPKVRRDRADRDQRDR
ncbi:hypothetical protein BAY61_32230 (plasmid) [Prauserella marina]|uniref:MobA/VirD2-like nuclease domain-containing protein n=1 Tax=Prauserella marina TaxID=530584 RepID=A0A222W1M2_9PSEU|nr:hypothetical protein [Prauserella marina]ASR39952.1 hypothetical protein BAY61_32230 [Prauserella marina]PWV71288.1 hypothetical protein DES30_1124 [Prauserella marina]SDD97297.1 hypothetical protein SAMN05421630_115108 [Prauserella marina]